MGLRRRTLVLVKTKDGKVKVDLPDGRTVCLEEKDAIQIIAERYAKKNYISLHEAKKQLGV